MTSLVTVRNEYHVNPQTIDVKSKITTRCSPPT